MKRTIGLGHENDSLYILDSSLPIAIFAIKGKDSSTTDELIM